MEQLSRPATKKRNQQQEQAEQGDQSQGAAEPTTETSAFNESAAITTTHNATLTGKGILTTTETTTTGAAAEVATSISDAAVLGAPLMEIERLTEAGIPAADVTKLKQHGIQTVPGIHMQCRKELIDIKGLSEAKVDKIIDAARKLCATGFVTGVTCLEQRKKVLRITTGSSTLDQLIGGGIESMAITEAFGEFRTGKTQIAHTLCVTSQLPTSMSGGNGKVIYVDTESTFRPERIKPIAERYGLDPQETLENIMVARAYTHEHQSHLLSMVAAKMADDQFSLLVVDSITALFRVDFSGRGELAERQQKLGKMMSQLIKIAEEFNVAVYITNQVVSDPGGASMFVADPKKPIGGHILAHASTIRLSLRKGRGEQRICKIYDSPCMPENECVFAITEAGIVDAKE